MKNVIDGNRLIAEFMGIKPKFMFGKWSWSDSPFFFTNQDTEEKAMDSIVNYVKYSTSWDWLMPVVHKCLGMCHELELNEWEISFSDKFFSCDIRVMFDEVVEFIRWHNENTH